MTELNYPEELLYTREHAWLLINQGGTGIVGISDFAQDQLDEVAYVDLPSVGSFFDSGAEFGAIESIKSVNHLYMPVAGEVIAVNDALADTPTLVNTEPYSGGWMLTIRIAEDADRSLLISAREYAAGLK